MPASAGPDRLKAGLQTTGVPTEQFKVPMHGIKRVGALSLNCWRPRQVLAPVLWRFGNGGGRKTPEDWRTLPIRNRSASIGDGTTAEPIRLRVGWDIIDAGVYAPIPSGFGVIYDNTWIMTVKP